MSDQNQLQQTTQQNGAVPQPDIFKEVMGRIQLFQSNGELRLPDNYAPENAIKSAFLIISDLKDKNHNPALSVCTKESISKALLKMVTEGLNPLKRQGSFIMYGNQLQWQREYAGNIALAKRHGLKDITGVAIFKGDKFEFTTENGRKKVTNHEQTLESIGSGDILGAYAICEMESGKVNTEIMNINQIRHSWNQGYAKGGSMAHKNFPDQMAIKTVINRACKLIINSSDDSNLITDELEENTIDGVATVVHSEIKDNANKGTISMDDAPTEEDPTYQPTMIITPAELPEDFK